MRKGRRTHPHRSRSAPLSDSHSPSTPLFVDVAGGHRTLHWLMSAESGPMGHRTRVGGLQSVPSSQELYLIAFSILRQVVDVPECPFIVQAMLRGTESMAGIQGVSLAHMLHHHCASNTDTRI
eukprot:825867-Pelagomonas_calceolata.AAC.12